MSPWRPVLERTVSRGSTIGSPWGSHRGYGAGSIRTVLALNLGDARDVASSEGQRRVDEAQQGDEPHGEGKGL